MHRTVHAVAARFGSPQRSAPELCRLRGRPCDSPLALRRPALRFLLLDVHRGAKVTFPRRLVKGGGFRNPKRLQPTNEPSRARERHRDLSVGASFLAPYHPIPEGLELYRGRALSRNRARSHRSGRHLPESASSRKHEHDLGTSEPRACPRLFREGVPLPEELRAAGRPERTDASRAPALRAGEHSSQRARTAPRPTGARRALRCHCPVRNGVGDAPILAQQPRFASKRIARTSRPPRTLSATDDEYRRGEPRGLRVP
jgi:hypothetical protein